jgi:hypothetical protein
MIDFNIQMEDINTKVAPLREQGESQVQSYFTELDFQEIVKSSTEMIVGSLPIKYRKLLSYLNLALTYNSGTGVIQYELPTLPVGEVKVYINYPRKSFKFRTEEDEYQGVYTVTNKTLEFEIAPEKGSRIFVHYEHNIASELYMLRAQVINLIAYEYSNRSFFHRDEQAKERFEAWKTEADNFIDQIQTGRIGLYQLDDLQLIKEQDSPSQIVDDPYDFIQRL